MSALPVLIGRVEAVVDGVWLRDLRVAGIQVVDALYFAVRDPDWGTAPLRIGEPRIQTRGDRTTVRVEGDSLDSPVPTHFELDLEIGPDGLDASAAWWADADLQFNRVGFCILLPLDLAGAPAWIDAHRTSFPDHIAPTSPFVGIRELAFEIQGLRVGAEFDERVEVEDQRNWIDASFKVFAPPLDVPVPQFRRAGARTEQTLRLSWSGSPTASGPAVASRQDLPQRLGLGASRSSRPPSPADVDALAALGADWLSVTLLLHRDWRPVWAAAQQEAGALGIPLDVALVAPDPAAVCEWNPEAPPRLVRLHAYDAATHVTTREFAEALGDVAVRHPGARRAGGARSNFTELNRAAPPLDLLDDIVFAANPQVHARDDASILTTPAALAHAVRDARRIADGRPVIVGPLTFSPVFNAVARDPVNSPDIPPDPRQGDDIAATWLVEALRASAAAQGATVYDARGAAGLIGPDGVPTPAYRALRALRDQSAAVSERRSRPPAETM